MSNQLNQLEFLTEGEKEKLALALASGHPEGFTAKQFAKVLTWAEQARCNDAILNNILNGHLIITVSKTDIGFKIPAKGESQ